MKKLLSILTISTLTASIPAPLLANTVQTRVKRDVEANSKDVTNGFDIRIKGIEYKNWEKLEAVTKPFSKIDDKWYIAIWHGKDSNNWQIKSFQNINYSDRRKVLDSQGNYELALTRVGDNLFINKPRSIRDIISWNKDNGTYFKSVYRWNGVNKPITPKIDNNGNIINWNIDKTKFQQGILFALVENNKTATWSNAGMRLTVDGETNININNSNVEEVYWDGAKQNMLGGKVNINVKPETSEKTHKLVIKYDINGTKYTSEDIDVVMAAKIEPTTIVEQQNLSELIKTTDLGNIIDNNNETIKAKIIENNSLAIDFSQITIEKKDDHSATLKSRDDSKSYQGSVNVTYNVVPATTVDLKIDVTSSASGVQIDKDYLAQLDKTKMTNKVDTFYYANGKSTIKIKQPSTGNVIIGKIYGCDEQWNKTSQSNSINPLTGLEIDKGQYGSVDGRYLIELQHSTLSTHTKNIYLQVSEKQKAEHYWDTPKGKQFEQWADDNGYKNIRGSSASQLNNLFELSKTWKQSLKHLDLKLDNFVVDNIKNVTQDEIDKYKTKLLTSVKEQVEKYVPGVVENTDYAISVDNLVAGDWTTSKDVKVQAVSGSTKLLSFAIKTIPVQQKEEVTALASTPVSSDKGGKSIWKILGIVAGSLAGLGLAYWLFKRFVFNKYFLPKIKRRRHLKLVEQVRKEEAEKDAQNNKGGEE